MVARGDYRDQRSQIIFADGSIVRRHLDAICRRTSDLDNTELDKDVGDYIPVPPIATRTDEPPIVSEAVIRHSTRNRRAPNHLI